MSLLRNNTDNSINFQRASCTLDGCVKIWTSRVDSVGTETGKLLSNLANEGKNGGDGDDDEGGSDNPDGNNEGGGRKRKNHRPESTLAKNAAQLKSKKLDLEFGVDPLFKKTCADFDEGGAQGLLMNHLSLGVGSDGGLRVVFDASDSMGRAGEEEEVREEPVDEVDLSYLRSKSSSWTQFTVLRLHQYSEHFLPDLSVLEDKAISHSLASFSFSKDTFTFDDTTFFRDDTHHEEDMDNDDDFENDPFNVEPMDNDAGGGEDFFTGDQAINEDYGGMPMPDNDNDFGAGSEEGGEHSAGHTGGGGEAFVPFDPRRAPNERDMVMAMTGDGDGDEGGMMDYFDQNFLKNWAGPEHWKLRKVVRKRQCASFLVHHFQQLNLFLSAEATESAKAKAPREKKEAFKIDFLTPATKDIKERAKELFAPVTRGAGINLPGTSATTTTKKGGRGKKKDKEKKDDHRLPDDMHFSSRQLVTLFLKPKFSVWDSRHFFFAAPLINVWRLSLRCGVSACVSMKMATKSMRTSGHKRQLTKQLAEI